MNIHYIQEIVYLLTVENFIPNLVVKIYDRLSGVISMDQILLIFIISMLKEKIYEIKKRI